MQDDNFKSSCLPPEVNVQKTSTGQLVLQMVLPAKASGEIHPTSQIDTFKRAVKVLVKLQDTKTPTKKTKSKRIRSKNKKKSGVYVNKKGGNKKGGNNKGNLKSKTPKNVIEKKEQAQGGKKGKKKKRKKTKSEVVDEKTERKETRLSENLQNKEDDAQTMRELAIMAKRLKAFSFKKNNSVELRDRTIETLGFGFGWTTLPYSSSSFSSDFTLAPSRLGNQDFLLNNHLESSGTINDHGKDLSSSISLLNPSNYISSSSSSLSTSVQISTSIDSRYPPLVSPSTPLLLSVT